MTTKVTILKSTRNTETLRLIELEQLAQSIVTGEYEEAAGNLRIRYSLPAIRQFEDGEMEPYDAASRSMPRVCFSSLLENRGGERINRGYTGMVMLEVENLTSYDEARAVCQAVAMMPQTLMAFIGVSGRSVKIVCRGEMPNGTLPKKADDIQRFHLNLYEKARLAYNAQLGVTIEKREPRLERFCYVGTDEEVVYNAAALPFYTDLSELPRAVSVVHPTTTEPNELVPGQFRYDSLSAIYEFNFKKAYDDVEGVSEEEGRTHQLLTRLAGYCLESGLPMGIAWRLAASHYKLGQNRELVRLVFDNTYHDETDRRYYKRKKLAQPMKNIPAETLLTKKINIFLNEDYELRKNVMRGVAEYRLRTGLGFNFQDLTEEARNSITMRALEQGIKCWDKDIRRYVNSDDIELYDPINDYLEHLPRWDGKDRVAALAGRVPTSYEAWPQLFHVWMRSMVAMWLGKGQLTGNALVPLLIGRQGCGKSSFCRILLPRELREYYNDRINFKNEQDLNLGLTSFALINLDEFDKISKRQQVVLKYLVSTTDVKYRPPYGKAYQSHRRYASFIGTTNEPTPLTDPSGSRRFVCVTVDGTIDFESPVDYKQLYAQLRSEVSYGEPYWLEKDEEAALMQHNIIYQQLNGLGEMLLSVFQRPEGNDEGEWLSLKSISGTLKRIFGSAYHADAGTLIKLGNFMARAEYKFESRRRSYGIEYWVKKTGTAKDSR